MPLTPHQLDARLRPWWSEWYAHLPEPQRQALSEYKSPRYPFYAIAADHGRAFTDEDLARFDRLDTAFAHAPRLKKPRRVWRGMTRYVGLDGRQPWSPPAVGATATFPAWTSVSLLESPAANEAYSTFANRVDGDYSVLMEITLPPGQPVIYMEIIKPTASHEAELLLPRGTGYAVTGFEPLVAFTTLPDSKPGPRSFRLRATVTSSS
jgi:hypothetical protein